MAQQTGTFARRGTPIHYWLSGPASAPPVVLSHSAGGNLSQGVVSAAKPASRERLLRMFDEVANKRMYVTILMRTTDCLHFEPDYRGAGVPAGAWEVGGSAASAFRVSPHEKAGKRTPLMCVRPRPAFAAPQDRGGAR